MSAKIGETFHILPTNQILLVCFDEQSTKKLILKRLYSFIFFNESISKTINMPRSNLVLANLALYQHTPIPELIL